MALEDRDWYREAERSRRRGWTGSGSFLALAVVAALVVAGGALHVVRGKEPTYEGATRVHHGPRTLTILPGLPGITFGGDSLYPPNDPWQSYLADEGTCPGAERTDLALEQQAATMACLVNHARRARRLSPLVTLTVLNDSSIAKARKIARCREFAHAACGDDPAADARAAGYLGAWGENLYLAGGPWGAPRVALDGWLNSPGHRENLFGAEWRTQGIAVMKLERFGDDHDVTLWVNAFGT